MTKIIVNFINLETGELLKKDLSDLKKEGMPEGFVVVEEISIDEWTKALQKAIKNTLQK